MRFRRALVIGVAAVVTALSGAWVLAPETVRPWLSRGRVWAESVPRPVVLAVGGLVVLLAWLVAMRVLAGLLYRVWTRLWPRLKWVLDTVLPDSPLVKFATGVMILLTMTVVIVGALPTLLDTSNTTTENITGGADGVAERLTQQGLTSNWGDVVEGDTASGQPACREKRVSGPDTDGDGLPDRWEIAGETPAGAALPGADPQRKDLYKLNRASASGLDPEGEARRKINQTTFHTLSTVRDSKRRIKDLNPMLTETTMEMWCLSKPAVGGETDTIGSWWSDRLPRTQRGVFGC